MTNRHFKAAHSPSNARFCQEPPYAGSRARVGRRAEGVRYEKRVHKHLHKMYPGRYLEGPWIQFYDPDMRVCQPDGLIIDVQKGIIILVEVKLRHCPEAYYQLRRLYKPVLHSMFPPSLWQIRCCEVVRWYDPTVKWPEGHILRENVHDTPRDTIGVHIYNKED